MGSQETSIVFGSNTRQYSEDKINLKIEEERLSKLKQSYLTRPTNLLRSLSLIRTPVPKLKPVQVRILELEWLIQDVKKLFYYLAGHQDEHIFENELIKVLLIE